MMKKAEAACDSGSASMDWGLNFIHGKEAESLGQNLGLVIIPKIYPSVTKFL